MASGKQSLGAEWPEILKRLSRNSDEHETQDRLGTCATVPAYLPKCGSAELTTPAAVDGFFEREFPSARTLMPDLTREFFSHPQGLLGTVYTQGWHLNGDVLLLGDVARAIVPPHGQGMNCAFEDCVELDRLMDEHHSCAGLVEAFERERRPNTDAIAQMR